MCVIAHLSSGDLTAFGIHSHQQTDMLALHAPRLAAHQLAGSMPQRASLPGAERPSVSGLDQAGVACRRPQPPSCQAMAGPTSRESHSGPQALQAQISQDNLAGNISWSHQLDHREGAPQLQATAGSAEEL